MIRKLIAILILLVVLVGVSGCASEKIKSEEQASQAVIDASQSIEDISTTLSDVDKTLT